MIRTSNKSVAQSYPSSSLFHPVVDLGVVSTAALDFQDGDTFKCDTDSGSSLTITIANAREGAQLALYIDEVNSESHNLTFPSGWKWLVTEPSSITADKVAVLALECFDGTTITAAWKEEA